MGDGSTQTFLLSLQIILPQDVEGLENEGIQLPMQTAIFLGSVKFMVLCPTSCGNIAGQDLCREAVREAGRHRSRIGPVENVGRVVCGKGGR